MQLGQPTAFNKFGDLPPVLADEAKGIFFAQLVAVVTLFLLLTALCGLPNALVHASLHVAAFETTTYRLSPAATSYH